MINGFYRAQERYLHEVEHEVVELALALAARILRREAQMDPLLLTGAVRVALGQLSESTRVVLQVPEGDLGLWADAMRLVPNLSNRPKVEVGEGMLLGECRIQTEMGSVDLGVKAQLTEIERGFFDRVGKREDVNQKFAHSTAPHLANQPRAEGEELRDRIMRPEVSSVQSQNALKTSLRAVDGQYLDEPVLPGAPEPQLNNEMGSDSHSESHSGSYDAEWTDTTSIESRAQGEAGSERAVAEVLP